MRMISIYFLSENNCRKWVNKHSDNRINIIRLPYWPQVIQLACGLLGWWRIADVTSRCILLYYACYIGFSMLWLKSVVHIRTRWNVSRPLSRVLFCATELGLVGLSFIFVYFKLAPVCSSWVVFVYFLLVFVSTIIRTNATLWNDLLCVQWDVALR